MSLKSEISNAFFTIDAVKIMPKALKNSSKPPRSPSKSRILYGSRLYVCFFEATLKYASA